MQSSIKRGVLLSLGRRHRELELGLASVVRAYRFLQRDGSLELRPAAFLAGKLVTESPELLFALTVPHSQRTMRCVCVEFSRWMLASLGGTNEIAGAQ